MQITASAVSLNVEDVPASSAFLTEHFGFRQEMAADGFASLTREDAGMHVAFLRRGLEVLPDDQRDKHATGLILAFTVDNLEGLAALPQRDGSIRFYLISDDNFSKLQRTLLLAFDWRPHQGRQP